MALHEGQAYRENGVSLEAPVPALIRAAPQAEDVRASEAHWLADALSDDSVYYFAVCKNGRVVGQILLHDIAHEHKTALVAYAVFALSSRRRGIGTVMLKLLQRFVIEETALEKLVIITSRDNPASQRIAEKCGFRFTGTSREDPVNGMVFEWETRWKKS